MKSSVALKKFNFLKKLDLPEATMIRLANQLAMTLKGSEDKFITPLARICDHFVILVEWDMIVEANARKLNGPLAELERSNRSKFGPRSQSVPWPERIQSLKASYIHQCNTFVADFDFKLGTPECVPLDMSEASGRVRCSSSSGLPFLTKKGKVLDKLILEFDVILARKDPCVIYTRTAEKKKTRNVWGYPFALTLFELMFYTPILPVFKDMKFRAALVSPDLISERLTEMIKCAMSNDKLLYSVDFAAFDSSVKYQYIIKAFEVIKSYYDICYHPFLDYICERMYSIEIVTPSGIYRGFHGVPSGATFTNEVDSIIQLGVALTCKFIDINQCQVQGDDGAYMIRKENIPAFEDAFRKAGMTLEKSKSHIASDYVIFCQKLYHFDYLNEEGIIGGIYPTYRAINRLLFQERYVDFGSVGLKGKDYFAIRTLTILEQCKFHPLFKDLVRFILMKEQRSLDPSDDSLSKYAAYLNKGQSTTASLNDQYDANVRGIRNFESYKLIQKIIAEEGLVFSEESDQQSDDS